RVLFRSCGCCEVRTALREVWLIVAACVEVSLYCGLKGWSTHHVLVGEIGRRITYLGGRPVEHSDNTRGSVDEYVRGVELAVRECRGVWPQLVIVEPLLPALDQMPSNAELCAHSFIVGAPLLSRFGCGQH